MSEQGEKDRSVFSRAFAEALASRSVTLTRLHRRLSDLGDPVSVATLSSWRSGARHPDGAASLAAVERIEQLLDLDAGALLDHLIERSRLGALGEAATPFGSPETDALVAETLDSLQAPPLSVTRELSVQMVTDVGRDGEVIRRVTRSLIQGVAPLTHELSYVLVAPAGRVLEPAVHVLGGRVDRMRPHETARALACVIALDRPLAHGETEVLELRFEGPALAPHDRETGSLAVRPVRDLVVWTRFHPDALPDWIEEFELLPVAGEAGVSRPVRPSPSVHQARRDFGPGALTLRWGYGARNG